jgi:thiamine biosynthesis lipoprotein
MGSPCELITEANARDRARDLARLAADEVWRIEDKFSRYRDDNIVHRINTAAGRGVEVDEETAGLLDFAVTLYELSDRKFDITSGVLRAVWRFDGSDRIPEPEAVRRILDKVGWDKVSWQRPVLTMPAGMEIDLGGIGKEYAADRAVNLLRAAGAPPSLVNLGGDLAVSGPPSNRRAWKVAIEGELEGSHEKLIDLRQGALTTSGDTRRFLLRKGVRYSHILDPTTGWPVPDAPRSVTVAADTCTQAGMISTMAMLRGQGAEQFLAEERIQSWCRR